MASPFVHDAPVDPEDMIDRANELDALAGRLGEARNSRLEGPRRYGKTSLIRAALDRAADEGAIPIEVNFLGCVSVSHVAERIERAYSAQLDGPLRRWFSALAGTLRPTISAAPAGVGVSAELQRSTPGLLDRLALPRKVQERTGRPCAIAFDEFQEVLKVSDELPGVFRSELEGRGHVAGYVFSGSHPGLMRRLFADRRHAFFGQATPVELGPLPAVELGDHIERRMGAHRRDPGEALTPLLRAAEGHPQRAMLLADHLFRALKAGQVADVEIWDAVLRSARREVDGELLVLWDSCTPLERRVLTIVAHRTVALTGREAAERFGLSKSGSIQAAVDRLVGEGHLVADDGTRTGWRVLDPLLAMWLREEAPA